MNLLFDPMNPFADEACFPLFVTSNEILAFSNIVRHIKKILLSCTLKSTICVQSRLSNHLTPQYRKKTGAEGPPTLEQRMVNLSDR